MCPGHGQDPGIEIIRNVWPDENPFETDRHALLIEAAQQLREDEDAGLVMEHLTPIIHGFLVVEGLGSAKTPS